MEDKKEKNLGDNLKETTKKIMDTKDTTKNFTKKDIEDNKGMAILSYILPPIPYFVEIYLS